MALDSLIKFRSFRCYVKGCGDNAPFSMVWTSGEFIEICDKHYDMAKYLWDKYQAESSEDWIESQNRERIRKIQFDAAVRQIKLEP